MEGATIDKRKEQKGQVGNEGVALGKTSKASATSHKPLVDVSNMVEHKEKGGPTSGLPKGKNGNMDAGTSYFKVAKNKFLKKGKRMTA